MGKISKRVLDKNLETRIFELFIKTIIDLKSPSDVENFIEDLVSPTEKIMLTKRLAIAILLTKKYTYDEIDNKLKVSRPTIMSVSHSLKYGKGGYEKVISEIAKSKQKEEIIDKLEELILQVSLPKRYGSLGFKRKQQKGKELYKRKVKRNLI